MTAGPVLVERARRLRHFVYHPWLWSNPDRLELEVVLGDRRAVEAAIAALGLEMPSAWDGVEELSYDPLPHVAVRVEAFVLVVVIANADRFDGLEMMHVGAAETIEAALEAAGVVGRGVHAVLGLVYDFTSWDERGWIRLERGAKVRFSAEVCVGFEPDVNRWVLVELADPSASKLEAARVTATDPPEPRTIVHRVWPPPPATRVVEPARPWPMSTHWPGPVFVHEPLDREAVFAAHPHWCDPEAAADLCLAFRRATSCPALPHPFLEPWRESIAALAASARVAGLDEQSPSSSSPRVGAAVVRLCDEWPTCTVCGASMRLLIALPASMLRELGLPHEDLAAFTCPACYASPWKDLVPSGMVAVRWASTDAGRLVPHPDVPGTRAASGLALSEAPTLPVLTTISRWLPGGAAGELLANTLVHSQDGLVDLSAIWHEWTTGPDFPYAVQFGGYVPWLSGEDRNRPCPTCTRPLRLIAWAPEHVIAGPKSREQDFALFACNRSGCDPHRVELSYERDG